MLRKNIELLIRALKKDALINEALLLAESDYANTDDIDCAV